MGTAKDREPFHGAEAKLNRAEKHLLDLDREIGRYTETEPYAPVIYQKPGSYLVQIAWSVVEEPSVDLSPLLGDCLHNLRSALDHIAYELVLRAGNIPSTDRRPRTQYPIFLKRPKKPVTVPPGIELAAQILVEESQPYHQGEDRDGHPLAVLDELTNRDKHRTLNLVVAGLMDAEVYLLSPDERTRYGGKFTEGMCKHDDLIAQFLLPPGVPAIPGDWKIEGSGTVVVTLQDSGPWDEIPVTVLLEGLLEVERSMLESFRLLNGEVLQ